MYLTCTKWSVEETHSIFIASWQISATGTEYCFFPISTCVAVYGINML